MQNFGANGQAGLMVVGNRVFALCEPAQLYCFDKASGEVLWHVDTGDTDIWTTPHLWKTLKIQLRKRRTRFASLGRSVARMEKARDKLAGERKAVRDLKPALRLLEARIEVTQRQLTELGDEISGISNYYLKPTSTICGYAYPTPCTDGKTLFVYFGGGTLRAYDINGEKIWTRFLSRPPETTGITASPTLSDGKLIVTHHDTLALDKKTGETLWVAKTGSGYNTPVATRIQALE